MDGVLVNYNAYFNSYYLMWIIIILVVISCVFTCGYGIEFIGKTEFPTAPKVSVIQLLFINNTTLVNAQDLQLPATTLADSCYNMMFYNWLYSLTTAPELPATTLANSCYIVCSRLY